MLLMRRLLCLVVCYYQLVVPCEADSSQPSWERQRSQLISDTRRKELLSREGPFFHLDRSSREIEFGATADLLTPLYPEDDNDEESRKHIEMWLRDSHSLAMTIWDPSLIEDRGDSVYRLQLMKLQFVTLVLQPWVDVRMKTIITQSTNESGGSYPQFQLQSMHFNPNVQIAPLLPNRHTRRSITAEDLDAVSHVVGEMQPSADGKSVVGRIAFSTSGILPPILALLPDAVLRAACATINNTIVRFAIKSFQKGAKKQYQHFLARQRLQDPEIKKQYS